MNATMMTNVDTAAHARKTLRNSRALRKIVSIPGLRSPPEKHGKRRSDDCHNEEGQKNEST